MIDILNGQQQTPELVDLRIRLLIPSTLDARGKHVRVLRKIFGFSQLPNSKNCSNVRRI